MSNVNMEGLPPEMQERIASIIEGAKQKVVAQRAPAEAPIAKAPNLMDHTIALRQEVAAMRQQLDAVGQVTEAVGNAVGQLYAMFHQQTTPTDQGATYSESFQQQVDVGDDY